MDRISVRRVARADGGGPMVSLSMPLNTTVQKGPRLLGTRPGPEILRTVGRSHGQFLGGCMPSLTENKMDPRERGRSERPRSDSKWLPLPVGCHDGASPLLCATPAIRRRPPGSCSRAGLCSVARKGSGFARWKCLTGAPRRRCWGAPAAWPPSQQRNTHLVLTPGMINRMTRRESCT